MRISDWSSGVCSSDLWAMVECPKPVIGAIDGPAVGMGAEFATQCDVRVASTTARIAWNFVRRGLVPDLGAGTFLLPRIIGHPEALRLLYSGEFIDHQRALEPGLVSAVVAPEALLAPARAGAARFLGGSPFAVASTTARIAWNFVRRGLVPDLGAGTFLLPRIIGHTEALRLLYSGEFIDAQRALELGFVSAVVAPEDLLATARAEAERFLAGSPFALARTKRLLYDAMSGDVAAHRKRTAVPLGECFRSDDHREGVASFLQRREI